MRVRVNIFSAVAAIVAAAVLCGCASNPPMHPVASVAPPLELLPMPTDVVSPEDLERMLDPDSLMTEAQFELSTAVQTRFGSNESFSGLEWVSEREVYIVWWYGEPPRDLVEVVGESAGALEIAPTLNSPAVAASAVRTIMEAGAVPGVQVYGAGATIDCSKLNVTAEPVDPLLTESDMQARIEAVAGFPVDLEIGSIVPIAD